jgi:hypothetical protein
MLSRRGDEDVLETRARELHGRVPVAPAERLSYARFGIGFRRVEQRVQTRHQLRHAANRRDVRELGEP